MATDQDVTDSNLLSLLEGFHGNMKLIIISMILMTIMIVTSAAILQYQVLSNTFKTIDQENRIEVLESLLLDKPNEIKQEQYSENPNIKQ